ncbi:hypothetical protein EMIHUDRAFT_457706 [Emiliania huxleyi CCMP1516]|uniref:Uncharacterized protein n=2 Tax=Emiliania huxleyi TaxID=2903 RepID=A0A0D3JMT1_EMIH1|nr:hypothetical protein EMIHUDRAFT_457706 [Emiliania huxleyi CCMP1516]EOD24816.1 hypothetical protein EMIHUDRAFT_457706 [Emiliania huxleyi CCMP1516]|eukprot:XP_005777245.1 hypothetical protein EMIHUDRAFT_457706 [Emiliania huxleyi CCMP1516]
MVLGRRSLSSLARPVVTRLTSHGGVRCRSSTPPLLYTASAASPLTLRRSGFELRHWPSAVVDFYNDDLIRSQYYPETAELVRAACGAEDVFVFQHMRRDSSALNKESGEEWSYESGGARNAAEAKAHGAVQRVHADYTPENGPRKLRELAEAGVVSEREIAHRRWSIVNVWRSIDAEQPVRAQPLAVLDASTVAAEDTFTYALVMDEAEPPLVGFNNGVGFSERHAWYYYPHMRHEEALLFYTYDGTAPLEGPRRRAGASSAAASRSSARRADAWSPCTIAGCTVPFHEAGTHRLCSSAHHTAGARRPHARQSGCRGVAQSSCVTLPPPRADEPAWVAGEACVATVRA